MGKREDDQDDYTHGIGVPMTGIGVPITGMGKQIVEGDILQNTREPLAPASALPQSMPYPDNEAGMPTFPGALPGMYTSPPFPKSNQIVSPKGDTNKINVSVANGPADTLTITITNAPTLQSVRILTSVLPKVLRLFLSKNRDYGDDPEGNLGPKAQFIDMYRKMKKLKRSLWEGQDLIGEQSDEIIADLIGHSLLALLDYKAWGSIDERV